MIPIKIVPPISWQIRFCYVITLPKCFFLTHSWHYFNKSTVARAILAIPEWKYLEVSSERETPPEYARTRMTKWHATLRDDTRLLGGAMCYVSISILRRCIANATVHCTSSLERAFGVSSRETCQLQRRSHAKRGPFSAQPAALATERARIPRDFTIWLLRNVFIGRYYRQGIGGWEFLCVFYRAMLSRRYRHSFIDRSPLPFLARFYRRPPRSSTRDKTIWNEVEYCNVCNTGVIVSFCPARYYAIAYF